MTWRNYYLLFFMMAFNIWSLDAAMLSNSDGSINLKIPEDAIARWNSAQRVCLRTMGVDQNAGQSSCMAEAGLTPDQPATVNCYSPQRQMHCYRELFQSVTTNARDEMAKAQKIMGKEVLAELLDECDESSYPTPNDLILCRAENFKAVSKMLASEQFEGANIKDNLDRLPFKIAAQIKKECPKLGQSCLKKSITKWRDKFAQSKRAVLDDYVLSFMGLSYLRDQCMSYLSADHSDCIGDSDTAFNSFRQIALDRPEGAKGGAKTYASVEDELRRKKPKSFKHCQKKWRDDQGQDIFIKGKNMYKFCLEYNLNPPPPVPESSQDQSKGTGQGEKGSGKGAETVQQEAAKKPDQWNYPSKSEYLTGPECTIGDMEKGCQLKLHDLQLECERLSENPQRFKWMIDHFFAGQEDGCRILNQKLPELTTDPVNRQKPEACYLLNKILEKKEKIEGCEDHSRQVKISPTREIEIKEDGDLLCPEEYAPYNCRAENTGRAGDVQKFLHTPMEMDQLCRTKIKAHLKWCREEEEKARAVGMYAFGETAKCHAIEAKFNALDSTTADPPVSCEIWFKDIKGLAQVPAYDEINNVARASMGPNDPLQDTVMNVVDIMRFRGMAKLGRYSLDRRLEMSFAVMANANPEILDVTSTAFEKAVSQLIDSAAGCLQKSDHKGIREKLQKMAIEAKDNRERAQAQAHLKDQSEVERDWHRQHVIAAREFKIRKCQQENCQAHKQCPKAIVDQIDQEISQIMQTYPALDQRVYRQTISRKQGEDDFWWNQRLEIDRADNTKPLFQYLSKDFYNVACDSSDKRWTAEDESPTGKPINYETAELSLIKQAQGKDVDFQLGALKKKFCNPKKGIQENLFNEGRAAVAFPPLIDGFMGCADIPDNQDECSDRHSFGWTLCADTMYLKGEEYKENKKWFTKWAKSMAMAAGAIALFIVVASNPYLALAAGTLLGGYEVREAYLDYRKGVQIERGQRMPDTEVLAAHSDFINGRIGYSDYRQIYNRHKGDPSVAKLMGTVVFETLMAALDVHTVATSLKAAMGAKRFLTLTEEIKRISKLDEAARTRFMEDLLKGKVVTGSGETIAISTKEQEMLLRNIDPKAVAQKTESAVDNVARDSMNGDNAGQVIMQGQGRQKGRDTVVGHHVHGDEATKVERGSKAADQVTEVGPATASSSSTPMPQKVVLDDNQRTVYRQMHQERANADQILQSGNLGGQQRTQRVIEVDMKKRPGDPTPDEIYARVAQHSKQNHPLRFKADTAEDSLALETQVISDYSDYLRVNGIKHEIVYDVYKHPTNPALDQRHYFIRIVPMKKGGHRLNRMAHKMQTKLGGTDLIFDPRELTESGALAIYRPFQNQISMSYDNLLHLDTRGHAMMHEIEHRHRDMKLLKGDRNDFHGFAKVTTDNSIFPWATNNIPGYGKFMSFDEVSRSMGDTRRNLAYLDSMLTGTSKRAKGMVADPRNFDTILEEAIIRNTMAHDQIVMAENLYEGALKTLEKDYANQIMRITEGPPGVFHATINIKSEDNLTRMDITLPLFGSKGPNDPDNLTLFKEQLNFNLTAMRSEKVKAGFLKDSLESFRGLRKRWSEARDPAAAAELLAQQRAELDSMLGLMDRPRFPGQKTFVDWAAKGPAGLAREHKKRVIERMNHYREQIKAEAELASNVTVFEPVALKTEHLQEDITSGVVSNGSVISRQLPDGSVQKLTFQSLDRVGDDVIIRMVNEEGKEVRYFYDDFIQESSDLKLVGSPRGPPPAPATSKVTKKERPQNAAKVDGRPYKPRAKSKAHTVQNDIGEAEIHTFADFKKVDQHKYRISVQHPAPQAHPGIPASSDLMKLDELTLDFKEINYRLPGDSAAAIFNKEFPQSPNDIIFSGGMRDVFQHPSDSEKYVKVFDPAKVHVELPTHYKGADVSRMSPELHKKILDELRQEQIKKLVEREMAIYHYLSSIEEAYLKAGKVPPFKVAKISSTPEQLEKGIIIQEKVEGLPLVQQWSSSGSGQTPDYFNRFINEVDRHQKIVYDITAKQTNLGLSVKHTTPNRDGALFREGKDLVGIDWGVDFSNVKVIEDPAHGGQRIPVFYDW